MKLTSQTPLTKAGLSPTQTDLLRSLWITSLDELLSVLAATNQGEAPAEAVLPNAGSVLSTARLTLSAERLILVSKARRGGGLGCFVDPQILDDFRLQGRIRPATARAQGAFEAKLPDAVRLMSKMPPVKNQGQRGTCVAFGTVALREFLAGSKVDLAEQFLYWACKELDGSPGPGTHIHSAMTALAEYGVCEETAWPYCPDQTNDEGQGPPPTVAKENAKKFLLSAARTVEPNLVINYKHVLAGRPRRIARARSPCRCPRNSRRAGMPCAWSVTSMMRRFPAAGISSCATVGAPAGRRKARKLPATRLCLTNTWSGTRSRRSPARWPEPSPLRKPETRRGANFSGCWERTSGIWTANC